MAQQAGRDVVIIGAGAAGLAAAHNLKSAGLEPLVVEARDRIGGRIWTDHSRGPVELGAEFVHGERAATWQLITPAGLPADPWPRGRRLGQTDVLYAQNGKLLPRGAPLAERVNHLYEQVTGYTGPECTARAAALALIPPDDEALPYLLTRLACIEAADVDRLSARAVSRERALNSAGWENYHIRAGYDALPALLARGLEVWLNSAVTRIEWGSTTVRLILQSEQTITARHVIVTVPLGVLQSGRPTFSPALPPAKKKAINLLAMGPVTKLILHFSHAPWLPPAFVRNDGYILTWWPAGSDEEPVLMGYNGGPMALELAALGEEKAIAQGVKELSQIFGSEVADAFVAGRLVDWSADPWSCGAYSYTPVGADGARAALAAPLAPMLFFAGEATSTNGHLATVHGAIETGWRAADEVLAVKHSTQAATHRGASR